MSVMEQPRVQILTSDQAERQREEIIKAVGGDEVSFRDRAAEYLLDEYETTLYEDLKALDFLLNG